MAVQRLYYLEDYADEVMPCAPTLEAWAAWLSDAEDEEWPHPIPDEGQTFKCFTTDLLGDVRADHGADGWACTPQPPAGTEFFYVRYREGGEGWSVEDSGDTVDEALSAIDAIEGPEFLACTRKGPSLILRYSASPPALTIIEGHA